MSSGFDDLPSVQRARLRARGRVRLQKMGVTEADLPEGVTLEGVGCISPPDEWHGSVFHAVADSRDATRQLFEDIPWLLEREKKLREAVDAGRRFERVYQESLGATPTAAQYELLDSLQSRFIDLYAQALADSGEASGEAG